MIKEVYLKIPDVMPFLDYHTLISGYLWNKLPNKPGGYLWLRLERFVV